MKKPVLFLGIIFLCIKFNSNAQFYFYDNTHHENKFLIEIGSGFGIMNCLTDLGGGNGKGKKFIKDINWKNSKFAFGIYAVGLYQTRVGLRLEANFGEVTAHDSILKNISAGTDGRYNRNLSFRSMINEFQVLAELHPLLFMNLDIAPRLSPYILSGVGFYSFDPKAKLKGIWYSLQPLRTEGQGSWEYPDRQVYKLSQVNISAGLGLRYEVNSFLNARLELNYRFLGTDYLDDVSTDYIDPNLFNIYLPINQAAVAQQLYNRQNELNPSDLPRIGGQRGNPKNKDAYFTIQLKAGIVLGRKHR